RRFAGSERDQRKIQSTTLFSWNSRVLQETTMLRFIVPALLLFTTGAAMAQSSGIPPEELNNTRRQAGDAINVCFDRTSLGRPFDEAVAKALGDALFLEVNVIEGFGGFPLNGDGFMDELNL